MSRVDSLLAQVKAHPDAVADAAANGQGEAGKTRKAGAAENEIRAHACMYIHMYIYIHMYSYIFIYTHVFRLGAICVYGCDLANAQMRGPHYGSTYCDCLFLRQLGRIVESFLSRSQAG